MTSFEDLGVSPDIVRAAADMGWTEPTPVQMEAVPAGLEGRDLIAKAQTGTGKTGAYSMIAMTRAKPGSKVPSVLIIAPTRELAMQVDAEIRKLSKRSGHCSVPVYGGADMRRQSDDIRRGADIIVGTPGRLRDMCERGILVLDRVSEVVIDEADRMMEMGFEDDLAAVLEHVPKERHTMMFSATMTRAVERLEKDMLDDPAVVDASDGNAVTGLTKQYVVKCRRDEKKDMLREILSKGTPKAIVFCATKTMVDDLFQEFRDDAKAGTLHGDMPQKKRERVVDDFKEGKTDLLIATDVAARGLDIDDISYVINYDMPDDIHTYIHRIGRTGRAGREGTAVSFVTSEEEYLIREFELRTGMKIEKRDVPEAEEGSKDTIRKVTDYDQLSDPFGMVMFEVGLGKADGIGKVKLADYIMRAGRIIDAAIGKIKIGEESSTVEVHKDFGNRMLMDVPKMRYRGKKVSVKVLERD